MVGEHHQLNGNEPEPAQRDGEGEGTELSSVHFSLVTQSRQFTCYTIHLFKVYHSLC